jgi:hypothetical protein
LEQVYPVYMNGSMMSLDDLRVLNAAGPRQVRSVLDRLIETGAATSDRLQHAQDRLNQLGLPYLACFAQIAESLPVEAGEYLTPGASADSIVRLTVEPLFICLDPLGKVWIAERPIPDAIDIAEAAQCVGYLPLRDRKAEYYRNYFESFRAGGVDERAINPDRTQGLISRRRTPSTWEGEIVPHARGHFLRAISTFVQHYRMLARRDIAVPPRIHGLFFMLQPGRVVTPDAPSPLISALIPPRKVSRTIKRSQLERAISLRIPTTDEFVPKLLSYAKSFEGGEHTLGWIGAVSVIEEYLSSFVEWSDPGRRPSIRVSLRKSPLSSLPEALAVQLCNLARIRNSLVHREAHTLRTASRLRFADLLDVAFDAYREIHIRRLRSKAHT